MINPALINAAIGRSKGTTFVSAKYDSPVKLAATFKNRRIVKQGFMHGLAFASVNDYRNAYEAQVKRDLEKSGDAAGAERFETQSNWFRHDENDAFSVVRHAKDDSRVYLYVLPRGGKVYRYLDLDTGETLTKEQVAAMMTPSAARRLLDESGKVENKTHGVTHSVQCRTTSLENIRQLRIMGHTLRG